MLGKSVDLPSDLPRPLPATSSVSTDTRSERDVGLGYIEVDLFFPPYFFFLLYFFSGIDSMSVSLGLSYECCCWFFLFVCFFLLFFLFFFFRDVSLL